MQNLLAQALDLESPLRQVALKFMEKNIFGRLFTLLILQNLKSYLNPMRII